MSNKSTGGSTNHETQWSEADYEKHFTDHGELFSCVCVCVCVSIFNVCIVAKIWMTLVNQRMEHI